MKKENIFEAQKRKWILEPRDEDGNLLTKLVGAYPEINTLSNGATEDELFAHYFHHVKNEDSASWNKLRYFFKEKYNHIIREKRGNMARRSSGRDIPTELKPFHKLFEQLCYGSDYSGMFGNFLEITMCFFARGAMKDRHEEIWNRLNDKQRKLMDELLREYILCNNRLFQVEGRKWYDFFGCYYEYLSSSGHRSGLGQFFTPDTVVDFMVQINSTDKKIQEEETGQLITGLKAIDPACGSGRFLIAFHVHNLGNYICGSDLDIICCKMSCLNMMLHGCDGEIVWKDGLSNHDYKAGWRINADLGITGIPSILPMEKEHSYIWSSGQSNAVEMAERASERETIKQQEKTERQQAKKVILKPDNAGQLELF